MKKHIPTVLIIVAMLGCTGWLTYLHQEAQEKAQVDRRSNRDQIIYRVIGSPYEFYFNEANLVAVFEGRKEILEAIEALDEKLPSR
ncbi:MAG: hypothetical protein P8J45_09160 [Phycisphaerales bacterium]|nr:hypothetical protein [Phycisphaerales bacterium]